MDSIALDAASNGTGNGATSITWAHTCSGLNRLLMVGIHIGTSQGYDVTNVTYAGVQMTALDASVTGTGHIQLWYLINPATGTNNIVTTKSSSGYHRGGSVSYTGCHQLLQPNARGVNSAASGTSFSHTLTSTVNNCWSIAMMGGNVISAGTGTTERSAPDGSIKIFDSGGKFATGNSTLTATGSNAVWGSSMAIIRPLDDPAGGSPMLFGGGVTIL